MHTTEKAVSIILYDHSLKQVWDNFVSDSRNGTFMLQRRYMEYHAHRFTDHSLLCYINGKLIALLAGCVQGEVYSSHAGLTYGGLILSNKATGSDTYLIMRSLVQELRLQGFSSLYYKCIPHIYHRLPSEDDLYALTRCGARLVRRDLSTTVNRSNRLPYNRNRQRGLQRANDASLLIQRTDSCDELWKIVTHNLNTRYGVAPVHTADEMQLLMNYFPHNIECWEVRSPQQGLIAGGVIYLTHTCIHLQYAHASELGKEVGALDLLNATLIEQHSSSAHYFDFGISTEQNGTVLNESLLNQKESFGGRTVVYDHYLIDL